MLRENALQAGQVRADDTVTLKEAQIATLARRNLIFSLFLLLFSLLMIIFSFLSNAVGDWNLLVMGFIGLPISALGVWTHWTSYLKRRRLAIFFAVMIIYLVVSMLLSIVWIVWIQSGYTCPSDMSASRCRRTKDVAISFAIIFGILGSIIFCGGMAFCTNLHRHELGTLELLLHVTDRPRGIVRGEGSHNWTLDDDEGDHYDEESPLMGSLQPRRILSATLN